MLGWILFLIGSVGFGLASYLDLKTTEFPDWLPYSLIILALLTRGIFSIILNDVWIFLNSVLIGSLFLGFGLLLYFTKQWGDGDAWLLGCLGFLFPDSADFQISGLFPFPVVLFINFFFVSFFYLVIYSLFLGIKNPKVKNLFFNSIKENIKLISMAIIFILIIFSGLILYFNYYFVPFQSNFYLILCFLIFVIFFFYYAKIIEEYLFKKEISVNDLKEGDVLFEDKWKGLKKEDIEKLKKRGGKVYIKEGVRFALVFLITLWITVFYGNLALVFLI